MSGMVGELITVNSSLSDPDESPGAPLGGCGFRHGREAAWGKSKAPDGDLVEDHRVLTSPTALGTGSRLFSASGRPAVLDLLDVANVGPDVLTRYRRAGR
ncbi:hypothetical protein [Actinacidiphila acidipaludis]|uniref:Uncharacterized protein n=1 Tax=Actinacidiphila acidipaludis TaxID=2873382 RepID=A0ABS7QGX5_9ACTN|nr:hypothetical protein [Streptomyces acidipaludis]MBY8881670.1 hypothetical protein [Streptomyces acidipaludis]